MSTKQAAVRQPRKARNLTVGSPSKVIVAFALPLLLSSLIQQLYGMVAVIFVGRYLGSEAAAAVGSSDLLATLLIGLFTGISVGSSVVAAQAVGAKDDDKLRKVISTSASFGVLGAAVLIIIGEVMAPIILRWMNTPEEILPLGVVYLRVYLIGLFSIILYNLFSGIVRALGDSMAAMRFQLYGGIANIIANWLFLGVFRLGVAGAAIAIIISQSIAALFTTIYLFRLDSDIALRLNRLKIDGKILGQILKVGIPSGIQAMVMTLSNIIVQSVINSFGVTSIAAFVAYFKVELFCWYPNMALGQALVTYTAQNIGAGEHKRVRKGTIATLVMGIVVTVAIAAICLAAHGPIFRLFNPDPAVVAAGFTILMVSFPLYWIYSIMETFSSTIKGMGNALVPMIISIAGICAVRVAAVEILNSMFGTIRAVAAVYPISWGATAVGMIIAYIVIVRKNKNMN